MERYAGSDNYKDEKTLRSNLTWRQNDQNQIG
jgi:hypothetical protein